MRITINLAKDGHGFDFRAEMHVMGDPVEIEAEITKLLGRLVEMKRPKDDRRGESCESIIRDNQRRQRELRESVGWARL